jgi:hypothetical protein
LTSGVKRKRDRKVKQPKQPSQKVDDPLGTTTTTSSSATAAAATIAAAASTAAPATNATTTTTNATAAPAATAVAKIKGSKGSANSDSIKSTNTKVSNACKKYLPFLLQISCQTHCALQTHVPSRFNVPMFHFALLCMSHSLDHIDTRSCSLPPTLNIASSHRTP